MWLVMGTCSDRAFVVGALLQHSATPSKERKNTLKCVFPYIAATPSHVIVFDGKNGSDKLKDLVDAD